MTHTSSTEEAPATPGWVDGRIEAIFAPLGAAARQAADTYANCLAGVRGAVDRTRGMIAAAGRCWRLSAT
ncbi:MAG: hypothetical protein WDN49_06020 [Acetobacteraceae bacterium]